jgi:cytochrome c oxidase cbb3-type subunit III
MSEYKPNQVRDHTFDGISEFDNRLPNWWLFILYASIVFSIGYWVVYHTLSLKDLPMAKYENEMQMALELQLAQMGGQEMTDEGLELIVSMPARVATGSVLFTQYCVVCHLADGQGLVGPNLTDRYWVHGGKPTDIMRTVTDGVPDKGMVAWGNLLGPTNVQNVVAHVMTLRNTEVEGKAPEGELMTE